MLFVSLFLVCEWWVAERETAQIIFVSLFLFVICFLVFVCSLFPRFWLLFVSLFLVCEWWVAERETAQMIQTAADQKISKAGSDQK